MRIVAETTKNNILRCLPGLLAANCVQAEAGL